MKILLLGANGRTGRQLLHHALEAGDTVTALVRGADRLADVRHERLTVHIGQATDPEILAALVPGHDVVVSTLGPRRPTKRAAAIYDESATAIVGAMQTAGVRRLLLTSSALLFPRQSLLGRVLRVLVFRLVAAATRMEARVSGSDLEWTIVRTGFLNDDAQSTYQTSNSAGGTVSRAGVASFLRDEIHLCGHVREIVGLSS